MSTHTANRLDAVTVEARRVLADAPDMPGHELARQLIQWSEGNGLAYPRLILASVAGYLTGDIPDCERSSFGVMIRDNPIVSEREARCEMEALVRLHSFMTADELAAFVADGYAQNGNPELHPSFAKLADYSQALLREGYAEWLACTQPLSGAST